MPRGMSHDAMHIREYLKHGELDIIQAKYSILDRALEAELLPLCQQNGIIAHWDESSGHKNRYNSRLAAIIP